VCGSSHEGRHAGEVEPAGALGEVLIEEIPVLAAELHGVTAAHVAERVGDDVGGVVAGGGQACRTPEIEAAGDKHLRQPDRAGDAVPDSKLRWIELGSREHGARKPVSTEANLVDEDCTENVSFADCELRSRQPRHTAESRNAVAARRGLLRQNLVTAVESMQTVVATQVM